MRHLVVDGRVAPDHVLRAVEDKVEKRGWIFKVREARSRFQRMTARYEDLGVDDED